VRFECALWDAGAALTGDKAVPLGPTAIGQMLTELTVSSSRRLEAAISARTARVAIVGQGYVGLTLAMAVAAAGFPTIGLDPVYAKSLARGISHVPDVPSDLLTRLRGSGLYRASGETSPLQSAEIIVVCVPTPLRNGAPDLSHIIETGRAIGVYARPGTLVVLESTTYPGTTDEILLPLIASEDRVLGETLFLAFSPERIDPGNRQYGVVNIPKVVGGAEPVSGELAALFYSQFVDQVVQVPGTREAEMAKLIENTFRHVNIALMNEMAVFCRHAGIDVHAAIRAAATKPFGYMAFEPGPGVGGHCIPVDPNYLAWWFRRAGERFRLVEAAEEVNAQMPQYAVSRISTLLAESGLALCDARVLVVGVAYKAGVNDWRESPAIPVIEALTHAGAEILIVDPFVDKLPTTVGLFRSVDLEFALRQPIDLAVILTPHPEIDYPAIIQRCPIVYDTRACLHSELPNIHTL
jgi:UDP-N-acetyl-D-glucosamine dehydrogenase